MAKYTKKQQETATKLDAGFGFAMLRSLGRLKGIGPDYWTGRHEGLTEGLLVSYLWLDLMDLETYRLIRMSLAFRDTLPVAGCDLELDGFPVMCPICGHRGVRSDMEARQVSPITIRGRCPTCGFIHA